MNHCPLCGLNLEGIQEAIEKEKEIWRPWDMLDSITESVDFTTLDRGTQIDCPMFVGHLMKE